MICTLPNLCPGNTKTCLCELWRGLTSHKPLGLDLVSTENNSLVGCRKENIWILLVKITTSLKINKKFHIIKMKQMCEDESNTSDFTIQETIVSEIA